MVRVLIAGLIAMVVSVVIGPKFIEFLRRNELGQPIREDGPAGHVVKQGTPVMGGLLIMLCATLPFLALSKFTLPALTVLFLTVSCAAVGFLDDFIKLRHRRSLGLEGRWKLLLLAGITVVVGFAVHAQSQLDTSIYIPVVNVDIPLSYAYYPFLFLVIAGAANGANLTDGLDGLAAGVGIIALLTFLSINVIGYIRSGDVGARSDYQLDLAILAAALIGAAIGFLWYNAFPAELFMGDTGSMAFGGALAGFAIVTGTEALLVLIAGIYVVEALSVIIQTVSFKYWGRRVFLIAPIHHHFEMKAWSETKIMVRFWIVAAILCGVRLRPLLPLLPPVPALKRALVLGLARSGRAAQAALEAGEPRSSPPTGRSATTRISPCSTGSRCSSRARACRARRRSWPPRASGGSRSGARSSWHRGCSPNPILGVTGTNGKTTTTELLGAMLGARTAGNVGTALSELVGDVPADEWIVCELSSFQLEDVDRFRPRIAVLLNLEPDHLDRHGSFEAYRAAKLRIFENQAADDVAVVPRGFGPVPGAARRVEFAADDELPAEPLIPGRAQPRERRRRDRGRPRGRSRRRGDRGRRCARSPASSTGSSSSPRSTASATSTTRRRRTPPPPAAR